MLLGINKVYITMK